MTDVNQKGRVALRNDSVLSRGQSVTLKLPDLHPKQYELVTAFDRIPGVRFVVGACGTKFGKTMGCCIWVTKCAWEQKDSLNWWVAPTYRQAENAMATVKKLLPPGTYVEYKAKMMIVLLEPDGSEHSIIEFKSAENPDSLRGFGIHNVVLDEAARNLSYDSFVSIWTTLTQTNGKMICISTPNGRGWFYDIYMRGASVDSRKEWPRWYSLCMPTASNPHVPRTAIEDAEKALPSDVFRQEYLAEFLQEGAGVFRGMKNCRKPGILPEPPQKGHHYVMGVDLARSKDFTVITVIDTTSGRNHVVYWSRFNQLDWSIQQIRIVQIAQTYKAKVWIDTTGIGDPIENAIRIAGVDVEGFKISGPTPKQQLIEKLRVGIEQGRLSWPSGLIPILDDDVRGGELQRYEYDITDSGTVRYSAPEGSHDDAVISLALAWWGTDKAPFIYRWLNARGI